MLNREFLQQLEGLKTAYVQASTEKYPFCIENVISELNNLLDLYWEVHNSEVNLTTNLDRQFLEFLTKQQTSVEKNKLLLEQTPENTVNKTVGLQYTQNQAILINGIIDKYWEICTKDD